MLQKKKMEMMKKYNLEEETQAPDYDLDGELPDFM